MIFIAILLSGLGFSTENTTKLDTKKCYDLLIEKGRFPSVEGFYLSDSSRPQTLDSLLDPVLKDLEKDSRLREEGREGIAKIKKDLQYGYPCTEKGEAFFPKNSVRNYAYTCFVTEEGVRRVDTKQFIIMQQRLEAASTVSVIPTTIFNSYVKMAASTIYENAKLLPMTDDLKLEVERAARNRFKGPNGLKLDAQSTNDISTYCSEAIVKATKTSTITPIQSGRKRPGAK